MEVEGVRVLDQILILNYKYFGQINRLSDEYDFKETWLAYQVCLLDDELVVFRVVRLVDIDL